LYDLLTDCLKMGLGLSLQSLVSFWTMLETSIGAVSRIRSFSEDTPSEDRRIDKVPKEWLHSGKIELNSISASHGPDSAPVLWDINLSIAPGEHIGICGRSGRYCRPQHVYFCVSKANLTSASGKSSLLSVLLQVMDIRSGSLTIDAIDTSSLSINHVRASLNTLSQESFFLQGTIRDNLTTATAPSQQPDERLEAVLTRTGLWNKVQAAGGLDSLLDAEDAFSHGERQLFCLARALLNESMILLLDEFTSKFVTSPPFITPSVVTG
jgi:ATP-binding cassette subfamily C (CFTR/MRP) protein 1